MKKRKIRFEKYLTFWVAIGMIAGIIIGKLFPKVVQILDRRTVYQISIPVAISIWGLNSGAVLATTVGVITEVTVMLSLVTISKATRGWFPS